jgi:tight adherence protein C
MIPDLAIILAFFGAISAFLFTVSCIPSKSPLSKTLEELEAQNNARYAENRPGIEQFIRRFLPHEQRNRLAQQLVEAGWYTVTPVQMVLRTLAAMLFGIIVLICYARIIHLAPIITWMLGAALFCAISYAPTSMLNRAIERRKIDVQKTLPDFLDMIASTVQAGLSLNAALAYAVDAAPGAIGEEVKEALTEIRLGRPRADALKAAADRLKQEEFSTMVAAITQAERLGSNVGKILNELADDTRTHRILIVEEHAAKLPVKMVFPMAFFLLPALFVIIFGSLVVNYITRQGQ